MMDLDSQVFLFIETILNRHCAHIPNLTEQERIQAAVERSLSRLANEAERISTYPNGLRSKLYFDGSEYLIKFSIGTPRFQTWAYVDTGSDITWLHCLPCKGGACNRAEAAFDPRKSETYKNLECESHWCKKDVGTYCHNSTNVCGYRLKYVGGLNSEGNLARETLTFIGIRGIQFPVSMTIGCGHQTTPTKYGIKPFGVMGLNRDPLSLIGQFEIERFSHCFMNVGSNLTSLIHLQSDAAIPGGGEKTPILQGPGGSYYLYLKDISVGYKRLQLRDGIFNKTSKPPRKGGFKIDSGTYLTFLVKEALDKVVDEMGRALSVYNYIKVCPELPHPRLNLCYCQTKLDTVKLVAPDVIFHFSGLDLKLYNQWFYHGSDRTVCFSLVDSQSSWSILGNHQLTNMNVGYDLVNNEISFHPVEDCSTL